MTVTNMAKWAGALYAGLAVVMTSLCLVLMMLNRSGIAMDATSLSVCRHVLHAVSAVNNNQVGCILNDTVAALGI